MKGLFIASTTAGTGKSLFSFSLGVLLQRAGRLVGYMKPVGRIHHNVDDLLGDADAFTVQEILGQKADANVVTPVMLPKNLHDLSRYKDASCSLTKGSALERITAAYSLLSNNKDVMVVSGTGAFPSTGGVAGADGLAIVKELGLSVLVVERFAENFAYDAVLSLKKLLGDAFLGIILNDVAARNQRDAEQILRPFLKGHGIPVFGIIPHAADLSALRVFDLAQALSGRIIAGNDYSSKMVEGFIIGAMQVDNFMTYLRQHNKESVVIVGGDRADLQLAALHGNCHCLILTGNHSPCEMVRVLAEKRGVPLISVREDTYRVARSMDYILKTKKISELGQIRAAIELVESHVDIPMLNSFLH